MKINITIGDEKRHDFKNNIQIEKTSFLFKKPNFY